MRRKLRFFFKNFWQAFFLIEGRELRLLLIILLLAFDLFIFITIERGISDALIKAPPPYIRYPQKWGVYLGYYFLIFIAFIAIGYAIYRTLKRAPIVERAKRIKSMRFAKRQALQNSKCLQCGGRVNYYQDNFCQGCGNKLL